MSLAYPLLNGVRHSWASVEIRVANKIILGCTKIDYSGKLEGQPVRGAGSRIIGWTTGIQENTGALTILLDEFTTLVRELQLINRAWQLAMFDIIATYDESSSGLQTIVDTIEGVRVSEVKIGTTEAGTADPTTRDLSLTVTNVKWNGIDGLPAQPQAG